MLHPKTSLVKMASLSVIVLCGLAGCAGGVPADAIQTKLASTPPVSGKSRLVIYRDTDMTYMGVTARVEVNGQKVAELWRGDAYATNVAPGPVTIAADAWSSPGRYSITLKALPDMDYTLEISPRGPLASGVLLGVGGMALDSAVNENSGSFQIAIKDVQKATTAGNKKVDGGRKE
ncbi:MAG: hypothetical protein SFW62_01025 [Alphaproteobacteria bacterium]|nr:hypothetical protein [Alphaproteobacteria bacterium]